MPTAEVITSYLEPTLVQSSFLDTQPLLTATFVKAPISLVQEISAMDPSYLFAMLTTKRASETDREILAAYIDAPTVTKAQMELCLGKLKAFLQGFDDQGEVDVLSEDQYAAVELITASSPSSAEQYYNIKLLADLTPNPEASECAEVVLTYMAQSTTYADGCPDGYWSTAAYWDEYPDLADKEACVKVGKCPSGFSLTQLGDELVCSAEVPPDASSDLVTEVTADEFYATRASTGQKIEKFIKSLDFLPKTMSGNVKTAIYGSMAIGSIFLIYKAMQGRK